MCLNNIFLENFITTFYGYGNYLGDYWFIGMEEGGGKTFNEVEKRFNTWQNLGEEELVDIYDFHLGINFPEYFSDPVRLQRTWMQQARIVLASKGKQNTKEDVKAYQRDFLGRKIGETCLLELFPLPSPSTSVWNYDQWSDLPYLQNRKAYIEHCFPWRCDHIHSQIRTCYPKLVVFFGKSYYPYWQHIAGNQVVFIDKGGYLMGNSGNTKFVISKHPAARGVTNAYFENIGLSCKTIINHK